MTASKVLQRKKFVNVDELAAVLGVSRRSIWRYRAAKQVPEPCIVEDKSGGVLRTVWMTKELRKWIAQGCPSEDTHKYACENPIRSMMMSHRKREQRVSKMQNRVAKAVR